MEVEVLVISAPQAHAFKLNKQFEMFSNPILGISIHEIIVVSVGEVPLLGATLRIASLDC